MVQIPRLREWREARALTQVELAERAGVSSRSVAGYEAGTGARPPTVRKLAEALGVEVMDLMGAPDGPKASSGSLQLSLNGALEAERRADWSTAVEEARRLRDTGEAQMRKALSEWGASKKRGEPKAARSKYLDEMSTLLQQAYDAENALFRALAGELGTDQWPELQEADRFYVELWRMVQKEGLSIRTKAEEPAVEHSDPGKERPSRVEEVAA